EAEGTGQRRLGDRPETLSRVGIGSERVPFGESCERRAAAGKAGAAKLKTLGRPRAPGCGHAISSHALALRKVCRAGFAARHAVGPVYPGGTLAVRPRPETESRVGLLAS